MSEVGKRGGLGFPNASAQKLECPQGPEYNTFTTRKRNAEESELFHHMLDCPMTPGFREVFWGQPSFWCMSCKQNPTWAGTEQGAQ